MDGRLTLSERKGVGHTGNHSELLHHLVPKYRAWCNEVVNGGGGARRALLVLL